MKQCCLGLAKRSGVQRRLMAETWWNLNLEKNSCIDMVADDTCTNIETDVILEKHIMYQNP